MSIILLRSLNSGRGTVRSIIFATKQLANYDAAPPVVSTIGPIAQYSRRRSSDPNSFDEYYKIVKSRVGVEDNVDSLGVECGPNWELLAPRGNRFYFPNSVGPAWQGANTTINLEAPLETLVDFEGTAVDKRDVLQFTVTECPSLIKKSLHELFPAPEVVSSEKLTIMTLRFEGDNESGARKFVLAAREISARLRLVGYWADFMNPFSGRPFYSWANGKNLYKVDDRFRGLNMKLITKNSCIVISTEDDAAFSGVIYTNAPSEYPQLKMIIDEQV